MAEYLQSNQEIADTCMLLHAQNASLTHQDVIVSSPDTDVFIIALSKLHEIKANMYMLTGTGDKRRLVDLNAVADNAFVRLNQVDCSKDKPYLDSTVLPGVILRAPFQDIEKQASSLSIFFKVLFVTCMGRKIP